jgi:hypothetical protein
LALRRNLLQGVFDRAQHGLGLQEHLVVPEAQNSVASLLEESAAPLVVALLLQVLAAIDLDHELLLEADEVDNVLTDRMLPAELVIEHLSPTQVFPQVALGSGGILSELSPVNKGFLLHHSGYNFSVA